MLLSKRKKENSKANNHFKTLEMDHELMIITAHLRFWDNLIWDTRNSKSRNFYIQFYKLLALGWTYGQKFAFGTEIKQVLLWVEAIAPPFVSPTVAAQAVKSLLRNVLKMLVCELMLPMLLVQLDQQLRYLFRERSILTATEHRSQQQ